MSANLQIQLEVGDMVICTVARQQQKQNMLLSIGLSPQNGAGPHRRKRKKIITSVPASLAGTHRAGLCLVCHLWPGSSGSCERAGFLCSPWHCAREGQNEGRGGWPDACRYAHPQWQFKPCTMSISKTSKLLNYINYREWGSQHCALQGCKAAAGLYLKLFQADGDGVVQGCE